MDSLSVKGAIRVGDIVGSIRRNVDEVRESTVTSVAQGG